jgi:fatty acid desaturase
MERYVRFNAINAKKSQYKAYMEIDLCKYKDLFGEPRKGLRKYRIFDIAILDVAVVIVIGLAISFFTKMNIWIVLGILFLSGIIAHRVFCVRTGVDQMLFS